MLLNCGVGEDSWESLGLQEDPTSPSSRRSALGVHWKDWCWSWNSNTLATWCEELTLWKRPWSWERLRAGGEGDDRGWDGWMASPTQWTWVWVNSTSWVMDREAWRAEVHGVAKSRTRLSDWTELNKHVLLFNWGNTFCIYWGAYRFLANWKLGILLAGNWTWLEIKSLAFISWYFIEKQKVGGMFSLWSKS